MMSQASQYRLRLLQVGHDEQCLEGVCVPRFRSEPYISLNVPGRLKSGSRALRPTNSGESTPQRMPDWILLGNSTRADRPQERGSPKLPHSGSFRGQRGRFDACYKIK